MVLLLANGCWYNSFMTFYEKYSDCNLIECFFSLERIPQNTRYSSFNFDLYLEELMLHHTFSEISRIVNYELYREQSHDENIKRTYFIANIYQKYGEQILKRYIIPTARINDSLEHYRQRVLSCI